MHAGLRVVQPCQQPIVCHRVVCGSVWGMFVRCQGATAEGLTWYWCVLLIRHLPSEYAATVTSARVGAWQWPSTQWPSTAVAIYGSGHLRRWPSTACHLWHAASRYTECCYDAVTFTLMRYTEKKEQARQRPATNTKNDQRRKQKAAARLMIRVPGIL